MYEILLPGVDKVAKLWAPQLLKI